jgi:ATP-binding cassette subfamily B protein
MIKLKEQGKTVIAISHRVSTAKIADRIILLDNGKISADGKHSDLLVKNKGYQEFWQ